MRVDNAACHKCSKCGSNCHGLRVSELTYIDSLLYVMAGSRLLFSPTSLTFLKKDGHGGMVYRQFEPTAGL
jgi:hypothetical protein